MKQIAVVLLLLVLGATAWGMTRVVVFEEMPLATSALNELDDNRWRRTVNGWQRLPLDRESPRDFGAPLHPAVVATVELCSALFGLLALSRCTTAKNG